MTMNPSMPTTAQRDLYSDTRLHVAILVIAVIAVYSNSLSNGFVWDDTILFIGKEFYASFDALKIFATGGHRVEYLPVRDMTYIADHAIWGWSPFGFHLTNVVFFALTVLAVYALSVETIALLRRYAPSACSEDVAHPAALFITLLFAVHPLQSQPVNFVTNRNVLVSGLFFFLSLFLFLRHLDLHDRAGRSSYLLSLLCFLLAGLSKATVIILPMILIVIVFFSAKQKKASPFVSVLPFAVLSVVFYILHKQVAVQAKLIREDLYEFGMHDPLMTAAKAIQIPFFYFYKIVVPKDLIAEYNITFIRSLFHPGVLLALAALLFGAWIVWKYRHSQPAVLFGFLWFIVTLIPVLNFYPTRPVVADRYAFLPLFGVFFPIGLFAATLARRSRMRNAVIAAVCALVLFLAYLTHGQNRIWESDISLWTDAASKAPRSFKPYANLGYAYRKAGDRTKSDDMFRKAGEIEPTVADREYLRGIEAYRAKDFPAAIEWFEKALKRKPGLIRALFYTGLAYDHTGDHEQAMRYLLDIRESPEYDIDNYRAGAVHYIDTYLMPRIAPKLDELKRAAEAAPEDRLRWVRLADALIAAGQDTRAAQIYRKIVEQGQGDWSTYYHLGEISRRAGDQTAAIAQYSKSLEMRNPNCEVSCHLGTLYMKRQEHGAAERILKNAFLDDPSCGDAKFHLAVSYFLRGDALSAIAAFNDLEESFPQKYPVGIYLNRMPER